MGQELFFTNKNLHHIYTRYMSQYFIIFQKPIPLSITSFFCETFFCTPPNELPLVAAWRQQKIGFTKKGFPLQPACRQAGRGYCVECFRRIFWFFDWRGFLIEGIAGTFWLFDYLDSLDFSNFSNPCSKYSSDSIWQSNHSFNQKIKKFLLSKKTFNPFNANSLKKRSKINVEIACLTQKKYYFCTRIEADVLLHITKKNLKLNLPDKDN